MNSATLDTFGLYINRPRVFTVGYQGKTFKDFVESIKRNEIEVVLDVRQNPHSYNKEFSSTFLTTELELNGIGYLGFSELGSPRDLRRRLRESRDMTHFLNGYARHLESIVEIFKSLVESCKNRLSALLCSERNWRGCHRRVLSEKLMECGFDVCHLG